MMTRLFSVVVADAGNDYLVNFRRDYIIGKAFCLYFRKETDESVEIYTLSDAVNERPL